MTYISIIYAIIATMIITVFFIYNITFYYSRVVYYFNLTEHVKNHPEYKYQLNYISFSELISDLLFIILNSIMIILLWLFLFMHINYQNYYITLLYLLLAIFLGTILILVLLYRSYTTINYFKNNYINPKFVSGIVTEIIKVDNKKPIISYEYAVNSVKYTNSSNQYHINYKKNDKITIIYSSKFPESSAIYDETIKYYGWIYTILLIIAFILLWIFFIYDIYNLF
jgi:hypothetical protein